MNAPQDTTESRATSLVVIEAGVSDPSSTAMLAQRAAQRVVERLAELDREVAVHTLHLRELLPELPGMLGKAIFGQKGAEAVKLLCDADGIIAAAPVYKAGPSALFLAFWQTLDEDLLIAKPVLLAATAGTSRHTLVVDDQIRSLFAYFRALTVPTSLFATSEDWGDPSYSRRIDRAAAELVFLMTSGFTQSMANAQWGSYQHHFGSNGGNENSIDFDSDLMRLATGGARPRSTAARGGSRTRPADTST